MSKKKHQSDEPLGQLGRVFQFTRDDLAANRAGYLTLPQQYGFKFWERKLFGWALSFPLFKKKPRKVSKITGKVKKHFSSRIVQTGSARSAVQLVLEKRHIQVLASNEVVNFYVNEKQYHALPEGLEMTLYYDPGDNRIVSVESPYVAK